MVYRLLNSVDEVDKFIVVQINRAHIKYKNTKTQIEYWWNTSETNQKKKRNDTKQYFHLFDDNLFAFYWAHFIGVVGGRSEDI